MTGTGSLGVSAGRMDGRKWVGVTRSMDCAPSSMRRRNVSRRASGVSASPAPPAEMTPFWQ